MALAYGAFFSLLTPPSQAPDEPAQFRRAYAVSEGQWCARRSGDRVGGEIPESVTRVSHDLLADLPFHPERRMPAGAIARALRAPLRPSERAFAEFPNTALYGFVGYAPQAAAIALARVFSQSVLVLFYGARLANAAVFAVLLALSVRATPVLRQIFFLAGLLPMAVFLAGSLSADAVTIGLAFLLTAWALRAAFGPRQRVSGGDLLRLAAASVLLALAKPGYLLLSGLVFLVPSERFGSRARYAAAGTLVCLAAIAASAAWAAALRSRGVVGMPSTVPSGLHEAGTAAIVARMLVDYARRAPALAVQLVGKLGWADVSLPAALVAAHGLLLLCVATTDGAAAPPLGARRWLILAAIVLGTGLAVAAPFYFTLRAPGPEGAAAHHPQGRYLLPLAPAALLLLRRARWEVDWERRLTALGIWAAAMLTAGAVAVAWRYYS